MLLISTQQIGSESAEVVGFEHLSESLSLDLHDSTNIFTCFVYHNGFFFST